jgi:hypothetical protein
MDLLEKRLSSAATAGVTVPIIDYAHFSLWAPTDFQLGSATTCERLMDLVPDIEASNRPHSTAQLEVN